MKFSTFIKKYTMTLALFVVFAFFSMLTGGRMLLAQNISNLLLQNAYVIVMACGMLLCILTGGNVDLSVGATLCLSAASAAQVMAHGGNICGTRNCTRYRNMSGISYRLGSYSSVHLPALIAAIVIAVLIS